MNSLLKHQVSKYLSNKNVSNEDLVAFIDAVNRSYENFDDQYLMQQRAMSISSEELSEANTRLRQETLIQSNLIDKLNNVIETLKFHGLPGEEKRDTLNLDGLKLAEFIDKQTKDIIDMNEQREKLLNTLEVQNQELSDYAYLVSHDLKSPLRSIDALTTWLNQEIEESESETGNKSENLKLIRANVEKMDNLISGILNYSTINKNKSQICDLSINTILNEVLLSFSIPDHVTVNVSKNLPIINGDKFRLKQLFENLIDNAIKYIDKEKGIIDIGFTEQSGYWQFYIKDNGKGIEAPYFEKVFKPFQKLENNHNATGIGLSICKKIVSAYDGKIWLESQLGKGSIFYFTLKK